MDKNAIKKYAVWARRELIDRVSQKALQYGITKENIIDAGADSINGKLLTDIEKKQRRALVDQINEKGYEQVMEEVAYTWFNRFSALRFMEVNGYLPSHVRVFTDNENRFKPQIISEAIHLDIDGLEMDKVYIYIDSHQTEELYKYLLTVQCNALNKILPGMFQKISDYTELLLPDNLLREGSVIEQMITLIPEDDWKDAVQIIGWLYQFYNIEPKAEVFGKSGKISKEEIPAATQLFTPDWIVRYMVENSLGRLWIEHLMAINGTTEFPMSFPVSFESTQQQIAALKEHWKYYLDEGQQEEDVQIQLNELRLKYQTLKPEEIKFLDPCMGSGHILVYAFDVLMQIYESYGYAPREAVASIVKNNLWGLDIDERAAQLAYFSVMMKARQYDRRFFGRGIQPNVYAIYASNNIDKNCIEYFVDGNTKYSEDLYCVINELKDADEYGSIIKVSTVDFAALYKRLEEIKEDINIYALPTVNEILPIIKLGETMAQKYHCVVTNPPYMGNMPVKMTSYVKKYYADEKYDLYAVFTKKCNDFAVEGGFVAMITQQAWMFLSSFEKFRYKLNHSLFVNMLQLGARAFEEISGEIVQTVTFVFRNYMLTRYRGNYKNLTAGTSQDGKEKLFFEAESYFTSQEKFQQIPGSVYAYWISENAISLFSKEQLGNNSIIKSGIVTGNNDYFLRLWHEINFENIGFNHIKFVDNSDIKWVPMHKGGGYRKHFGLHEHIMNLHDIWEPDKTNVSVRRGEPAFYFKEGLTWSTLSNNLSVRRSPKGFVFDTKGSMCFANEDSKLSYMEALLNSKVASFYMSILSPTLDFNQGAMAKIPFVYSESNAIDIENLSNQCVQFCKEDWDSYETSWDFKTHPLIKFRLSGAYAWGDDEPTMKISNAFKAWELHCEGKFEKLKSNEEELNRYFIDIYGLNNELSATVDDSDISINKANLNREIKSLISFAVGCMFGRYSLDVPGLVYAGGIWDESKYQTIHADKDNIIPICDDEYFEDDIVGRFVKFIEVVYGIEALNDNLQFIADALGGKGTPKEVIRNYFINDFYNDHCKIYQKRPIYWQFDSGKKNGFKALMYMHRYQPDTIARLRTDYVHEQQSRYRTAIADLQQRIDNASTGERVKLNKELVKLQAQETEIRLYEEKVHHLADQMIRIDLDDGVKKNYEIFKDILAKIK